MLSEKSFVIPNKLKVYGLRLALMLVFLLSTLAVQAQCAMCRSSLENNVSDNEGLSIAAQLNMGIIYLFATPYVLIAVIAYLWYRKSKKRAHAH
jgi:hypothetical protein